MYELPSRDDVATVLVDEQVVTEKVAPTLVPRDSSTSPRPRRAAS